MDQRPVMERRFAAADQHHQWSKCGLTTRAKDCAFGAIVAATFTEHQPVEPRVTAREPKIGEADRHWILARPTQCSPNFGEPFLSKRQS